MANSTPLMRAIITSSCSGGIFVWTLYKKQVEFRERECKGRWKMEVEDPLGRHKRLSREDTCLKQLDLSTYCHLV